MAGLAPAPGRREAARGPSQTAAETSFLHPGLPSGKPQRPRARDGLARALLTLTRPSWSWGVPACEHVQAAKICRFCFDRAAFRGGVYVSR